MVLLSENSKPSFRRFPDLETMQSSPILLDLSSAFHHPRAAALATTSAVTNSHPPTRKFHSLSSFCPSSTLLASSSSSSRRCFTCRFGDGSSRFDSSEDDYCSEDETEIEIDDDDDYCLTDGKTEELVGDDGVLIEVKKLEKSSRRIRSKIGMEASLDSVWSVLTDYEKLSDFIPGLVVSELVEKEGNRVRLFQVFALYPVLRIMYQCICLCSNWCIGSYLSLNSSCSCILRLRVHC